MSLRPRRQSHPRRRPAAGLNVIARVRFASVLGLVTALTLIPLGLRGAVARQEGAPGGANKSVAAAEELSEQTPAVGRPLKQRDDRDLDRVFRKRESIKMNPAAAARRARETGKLAFATSDKTFDIELEPNDLRSADYRAEEVLDGGVVRQLERGPVRTFKGVVRGMAGAQARFTIDEDGVEGAVITRGEPYFIEPAREYSKAAAADEFVLYKASDVIETAPAECGTTLAEEVAAEAEAIGSKQPTASALAAPGGAVGEVLSPMRVIELATDADYEYHNALGGSAQANNQIQQIINQVDGIYQVELGLTFTIVFQNVYATADDPYTRTEASGQSGALAEFRDYWNANRTGVVRDVAHLWTGKDLSGSTIGVAYLASTCRSPNFAYGISQRYPTSSSNPITAATVSLTAHEIGHNFSAQHTNEVSAQVPADLGAGCGNTIMEASLGPGTGMNFCSYSRSQIEGHANAYSSCLATTSAVPPSSPPCGETPISSGAAASGSLSASDCRAPSRGVGFYADRYSFNATAGQPVTITLSSASFDSYLYLIGPDGSVIAQNDDGEIGNTARIPPLADGNSFTLPLTGKYYIEATSYNRGEVGDYTLGLSAYDCIFSITSTNQSFSSAGGIGSIGVTARGSCPWSASVYPSSATWITINSTVSNVINGTTNGTVNYSVTANSGEGPRTAALIIAGQRVNVTQSGTGPDCALTPIGSGQTVNGALQAGDCRSPNRGARYADRYTFSAAAGQQAVIALSSSAVDTFLTLIGPNGAVVLNDDDSGGETNSRIPGGAGPLTLLLPGTYTVEASTYDENQTGSYALTLSLSAAPSAGGEVQFGAGSYTASEGAGRVDLQVVRAGDASAEAYVWYASEPDQALRRCDAMTGQASERCDYVTAVGRLRFAPGQASAVISIPVVDDAYAEGSETLRVGLSEVTGGTLGGVNAATVTIQDNDASSSSVNPVDALPFFVRQQYLDFLAREPEQAGFDGWMAKLAQCPPSELDNRNYSQDCTRIDVSAAFFRSQEFQFKGYYVYRFYSVSLGARPSYQEFIRDTARVKGATDAEFEANRAAFPGEWVQRSAFRSRYDALPNAAYVDTLLGTAGLASALAARRDAWVGDLNAGTKARSQVLREVVESAEAQARYYNEAFVAMQYFGYLRRDPDAAGYAGWLTHLNGTGNYREMVWGFLYSPEYKLRFGPVPGF